MKIKWYISALIIIVTFFGLSQQPISNPNQEIVLKFENVELTKEDTQVTIAILKEELQNVGVNNFKVTENDKGTLKIKYYSDANVAVIKRILSKRIRSELGTSDENEEEESEYPFNQDSESYNLDIYELQNGNESESGLNGTFVLEFKVKSDRFSKPTNNTSQKSTDYLLIDANVKTSLKTFNTIALVIHDGLYHVPEVRAGPVC